MKCKVIAIENQKESTGNLAPTLNFGAIFKTTDLIDTFEIPSKSVIYWSILHIVYKNHCNSSQT